MIIRWTVAETRFGAMLVAATERGLCRVSFDTDPAGLARAHPRAELVEDAEAPIIRSGLSAIEDPALGPTVPLDCGGTPFQQRVWAELRRIPPGETRSYLDIARALGHPKATRAVGSANGANPVAIIVPCHRVLRHDGALGGYAGGLERKRALLAAETGSAQASFPFPS
jgi:AraC family transcriptional regulator of adaptative response/methylated-DNA-[protein]-cysteine methyltransferase